MYVDKIRTVCYTANGIIENLKMQKGQGDEKYQKTFLSDLCCDNVLVCGLCTLGDIGMVCF